MTKQHRAEAYKHFRDLQSNYVAVSHLDKGITATNRLRAEAKKIADALVLRNPELAELDIKEKPSSKKNSKVI